MNFKLRSVLLAVLFLLAAGLLLAEQQRQQRRRFLRPETPTSNDPRRVPVPEGYLQPEGTIVLTGGRVFDGTGSAARPATVVIEKNLIQNVLPPGSTDWPEEASVLRVDGKTVMPGLVDLHTHIAYEDPQEPSDGSESDAILRATERLRYYVESGITSIRDVASRPPVPFRLKLWVAKHRLPYPRIFAAGQLITATGGHGAEGYVLSPDIREASGPDDWREAVREQFKAGADLIKIASHFSEAEVAAAVQEAHALGLKVTADAETFYIERAVGAGVDMIEHPLPRSDETISLMAERGTQAIPTLIPYIFIFDAAGGYFGSTSRRFTFSKEENLGVLKRLRTAGISTGIGTDLVVDWYRALPYPYITELQQFVAAGYSTSEALVAATRTGAEILDMGDRLGTIVPGMLADVIVVDGSPDEDLADLANIDLVIRDGQVVVRDGRLFVPRHEPENVSSWIGLKQSPDEKNEP